MPSLCRQPCCPPNPLVTDVCLPSIPPDALTGLSWPPQQVIVLAFSYHVQTGSLQEAYQNVMLLLFVSAYAFTASYLLLPTELDEEWRVLENEVRRTNERTND